MKINKPIYLDYQSTTPIDKNVLEYMLPFMQEKFGNPSSQHVFGWEAEAIIDLSRKQIANAINALPEEIIFTSGATESNNLAIKGLAQYYAEKKNHIITSAFEHKCVLQSCKYLENKGYKVTYLPITKDGFVDLVALKDAINEKTLLVSIMFVNNEIGTIQNMDEISKICKENQVFLHSDAAQAIGKFKIDVKQLNIDLMSVSSHKIYGPKGVGALYIRQKPAVRLKAQLHGGEQENGLRSGTLPAFLIAGFGKATEIANQVIDEENNKIKLLRDRFLQNLTNNNIEFTIAGDMEKRIAGNLNFALSGIDADKLISKLGNIALSTGSACASNNAEPSYVLKALGMEKNQIKSSFRIGIGRFTTQEEIDNVTQRIKIVVRELKGN